MQALVSSGMYESGYAILKALAINGVKVRLIHTGRPRDLAFSRYVASTHRVRQPRQALSTLVGDGEPDGFAEDVLRICERTHVDLVIPTLDNEVVALAAQRERFAAAGVLCTVPPLPTIRLGMDKYASVLHADAAGLPCPRTELVSSLRDAVEFAGDVNGPVFLKRRFSSGSKGVLLTRDEHDLTKAWHHLADAPLVVQEQINGSREPSINAIITADGSVPLAFSLRKRRYLNNSVSTCVEIVEPLAETASALGYLKSIGIVGFSAIQLREDVESGRHVFIESNMRWGANARMLLPLLRKQGIDAMSAYVAAWSPGPYDSFRPGKSSAVSPFEDLLAIESFAKYRRGVRGHTTAVSWRRLLRSYAESYLKTRPLIVDDILASLWSDPSAVLSTFLRATRERGRRDLSFLPVGDLTAP